MPSISEQIYEAGVEAGMETGIVAMIKTIQKFSKSSEDAVIALMEDFSLPESKARDYVSQHWDFTCEKKDDNNGKN